MKEPAARMEKISPTMVLHKHIYQVDTRFYTMEGTLVNSTMGKWLGVIRRGTFQAAYENSRWTYEQVSDLWPNLELSSNYSNYGSIDEGIKDQNILDDQ